MGVPQKSNLQFSVAKWKRLGIRVVIVRGMGGLKERK